MVGIGIGIGYNNPFADANVSAFLAATGINSPTQVNAINTLVVNLKMYGLWNKMKALYPFVTDNRNLLGYTEDFGNGVWANANLTLEADSIISPSGVLDAYKLQNNATAGNHFIRQSISVTSGTTYTLSVYLKKGTKDVISIADGYNANDLAYFDLTNETATNVSGTNSSIQVVGNGWYRCSVSITTTTTTLGLMLYSGTTYAGVETFGYFYAWGTQLELGSTASTYQPIATTQQAFISNQFKYNLKNPVDSDAAFRLVFNGGWTFASTGATPNGTNGYADTFLTPSTSLSTSSAHLSYYSRTNSNKLGYELARVNYGILVQYGNTTFFVNLESGGSYSASASNLDGRGFYIGSRLNDTTVQGFKNNNKLINASLPSTLATQSLLIGGNGVASNYTDKECAFSSIGDGLTDTEASNFYSAVNTFQNSLNRAV